VILLGRTVAKLEAVYDEIEQIGGPKPAIYPVNLEGAVLKDYEDMAAAIENEFGHLDGLLHNAALLGTLTPIEHYDPDTWTQLMKVNLTAPFLMSKAIIPIMRESEDPSIVFTSSSVGRKGRAYWGGYAVSKFGIEGLMQVMADELDDKPDMIRVNSVNPGATRTSMRTKAYPAENPEQNPWPEQIMNIYLYLMGKDSSGVTGQAFDAQPK
jgi:NAD(P)-dependent dehydrogenase (short-subunit alcohol dehydrogenase family)